MRTVGRTKEKWAGEIGWGGGRDRASRGQDFVWFDPDVFDVGGVMWRKLFEWGCGLILPAHCLWCLGSADEEEWCCAACRERLPFVGEDRCARCSRPAWGSVLSGSVCGACRDVDFAFGSNFSVFRLEGEVREMVHRMKYRGAAALAGRLGYWLGGAVARRLGGMEEVDALIPVPLSRWRWLWRGYNQAELLARAAGVRSGVRVLDGLERLRHQGAQVGEGRGERLTRLRGAFQVRRGVAVRGMSVVLVDDVFTTGGTLDACARALVEGGVRSVRALTLCRG